jgi:hypothetical protein
MRLVVILVSVLAIACGSHSNGAIDAPGNGAGDSGNPGGDGNTGGDGNGGGGATISVTLTNRPTNAAMFTFVVAVQDGAGAWALAPAPSGDTYTFHVNSPSWGVAWTCIGNAAIGTGGGGQIRQVAEAHFAVSERTSLTMDVPPRCTDNAPATVALTGTVSNRSGGGLWVVDFGGRTGFVNPNTGGYRVEALPGTHDVILRHLENPSGVGGDFATTETVVDRAVTVTGATTHDIDASAVIATQAFAVNILLSNSARAVATTLLYSAGGTDPTLDRLSQNFESDALDPSQGLSGDVYDQQIAVSANGQTAIVTNATTTPGDQTFTAPSPLGGAASMVTATTPYPMIHTTWSAYASTIGYVWSATQVPSVQQCGGTTPCSITWTVLLSPGVTGQSPGYQMPDLSALTGWSANLAFIAGTMITGYAEAATSSGGASDFPPVTPPPAGTQRTYVRSDFTVTP